VEILTELVKSLFDFVKTNVIGIVAGIILLTIFYFVYYITTNSLKKLKTEILSSYPFDLFLPSGGTWSISYFLIVVLFLGLLIYFLSKGGMYLGPA
jgi:divalent metal cation (Fe/Co/Zn/Cd) transporter